MTLPHTQLYIQGKYVDAQDGSVLEVRNPLSKELVGTASSASSEDCNRAIAAASSAFESWEETPLSARRDVLLRAAELLASDEWRVKILRFYQEETGAAPYWANWDWKLAMDYLRTSACKTQELHGSLYTSTNVPGAQVIARRRGMGVVFAIVPWNAPVILSIVSTAVPLLCGNVVVMKGAELSPRSQALVLDLYSQAGLPAGVLNYLIMSRANAPALTSQIIAHPAIRAVAFTGSHNVGRLVAKEAAQHLKPCVMELGGKAPVIVLNDASVEEAAKAIAFGALAHSGQVCMSTERILVQSGVAERLVSLLSQIWGSAKAGDVSFDASASVGALCTDGSTQRITELIADAKKNGADILVGPGATGSDTPILQPHLVSGVTTEMRLWKEESFGPVATISVFETTEEGINLANASDYSLAAAVWTKDIWEGQKIASRIYAGSTNINGPTLHVEPTDGLVGLSGFSGYGRFSVDNFTHKRLITIHPSGREYPICN